jgi:DNA-binding MarR family transcriptional regulator
MLEISMGYSDKIVLKFLRDNIGERPELTIRMKEIAEQTGVTLPTVERALKRLERAGTINRERQTAYVYTYKVKR